MYLKWDTHLYEALFFFLLPDHFSKAKRSGNVMASFKKHKQMPLFDRSPWTQKDGMAQPKQRFCRKEEYVPFSWVRVNAFVFVWTGKQYREKVLLILLTCLSNSAYLPIQVHISFSHFCRSRSVSFLSEVCFLVRDMQRSVTLVAFFNKRVFK